MDGTHAVILGGEGAVGETLAVQLANGSPAVTFLAGDAHAADRAAEAGADARVADPSEPATLDREDIGEADIAIVTSRQDSQNLLLAQFLRLQRTGRVIALVNDPANLDAFAEAGIETVCASTALSTALDRQRRGVEAVETQSSSNRATADRRTEYEEPTDEPERERLRSGGAGGDA
ncbi:NAD-binding protein [Halococcus saccharolyticus]|uniref:K+ transporter NAD-binding component n=1 Tax=Halococcus saccharolyticus DSM 5350 TaxID=1227455 RepID=M0MNL0_9EURY|nr:NAD-binding protein [Halococcus saccharolyticus]EMA47251.1 K+ transporter NAD-binding component [Halococcus saccharolyticus DSM 5350]